MGQIFVGHRFAGREEVNLFCHSERGEESLFDLSLRKEREILRFARNDKMAGAFPRPVHSCRDRSKIDLALTAGLFEIELS